MTANSAGELTDWERDLLRPPAGRAVPEDLRDIDEITIHLDPEKFGRALRWYAGTWANSHGDEVTETVVSAIERSLSKAGVQVATSEMALQVVRSNNVDELKVYVLAVLLRGHADGKVIISKPGSHLYIEMTDREHSRLRSTRSGAGLEGSFADTFTFLMNN